VAEVMTGDRNYLIRLGNKGEISKLRFDTSFIIYNYNSQESTCIGHAKVRFCLRPKWSSE